MSGVTLQGATSGTVVHQGDKFRATWLLVATQLGLPVNAPAIAQKIIEALPLLGFLPVSNPSAVLGDKVIVYDVRLGGAFPGHTVADVAARLDQLPILSGGWAANLQALQAVALAGDGYAPGTSPPDPAGSAGIAAGIDKAKDAGNQAADAGNILDQLLGKLKTAGAAILVAGAVVLFVVLKGKSKDWE